MRQLLSTQSITHNEITVIQKAYKISSVEYEEITEYWIPKVNWFTPPRIGFFKWAYRYKEIKVLHSKPPELVVDVEGVKSIIKGGID